MDRSNLANRMKKYAQRWSCDRKNGEFIYDEVII